MRHGDIIIKQLCFHQEMLESEFQSLTANLWISLEKLGVTWLDEKWVWVNI